MDRRQKVWLGIFGAMFLVPEILWSPMISFIYILIYPGEFYDLPLLFNLLPPFQNNLIAGMIEILQFVGLICFSFLFVKYKENDFLKILILTLTIPLVLISGFIALMGFYYILNSPQIG
ncbi:MAG TPA: hypothetical protein PLA19_03055 [Candidatus Pacearchaeota archaeon]|nr:hypothetical protein [Candidatus Pacearchaeota archaeon]